MILPLSENEINELKYQCRMGYILPFLFFAISTVLGGYIYETYFNYKAVGMNLQIDLFILIFFFIFSVFLSFRMNRKLYLDIRNKEKVAEKKIIQRKIEMKDYEAGSGNMTSLPHNNPMKEFMRYDIIIENTKYRVDKDLFDNCSNGNEVLFLYAPISRYRLSIIKN